MLWIFFIYRSGNCERSLAGWCKAWELSSKLHRLLPDVPALCLYGKSLETDPAIFHVFRDVCLKILCGITEFYMGKRMKQKNADKISAATSFQWILRFLNTESKWMVPDEGLEPSHPMGTTTSRLRVYQFHQPGTLTWKSLLLSSLEDVFIIAINFIITTFVWFIFFWLLKK